MVNPSCGRSYDSNEALLERRSSRRFGLFLKTFLRLWLPATVASSALRFVEARRCLHMPRRCRGWTLTEPASLLLSDNTPSRRSATKCPASHPPRS